MSLEKYKSLYEYSRKSLDEELDRFKSLDDKASKLVGFLTLMVAGYTAILKFTNDIYFPPQSFIEWVTCFFILISYILLITVFTNLIRTLRIVNTPRMPLNNEVSQMFKDKDLEHSYNSLSDTCCKAVSKSKTILENKSNIIQIAYKYIVLSLISISISVVLLTITAFLNSSNVNAAPIIKIGESCMSENTDEPSNTPNSEPVESSSNEGDSTGQDIPTIQGTEDIGITSLDFDLVPNLKKKEDD